MKKSIPFGKYYLLDRIAVGGMAEVFKAKVIREEGFERYFAIKRILPSIAEDDEFIKMFIDEAKIAVQLTHGNIVPIIDLGKVGDAYFIAMEYVHGKDLRTMTEELSNKGDSLPIPACCYVIMKVCEGLDYAHNKKDAAGRDLNLVHRDVSPQNMLISFDGEVKIIDFGIAKAANKAAKTQAGILKGKFGYMSPEQVRGLPLDRRSDIFAAGVVLYESLTGERLFVGESDFSILEKVKNVEIIPPSTYNKNIPEDLESIILKALAREVQDRYQMAIELHDDLQSFMYTYGSFFSRKDMAALMKNVFPEDYDADVKEMESARISVPPGQAKSSSRSPHRRISAPPPPPPRSTRPAFSGGVGSVPPPPPSRGRTSIPPPPKKTVHGMPAPMMPHAPPPAASFSSPPSLPARPAVSEPPAPSLPGAQPVLQKPPTIPPAKSATAPSALPPGQAGPSPEARFTYPSTEMTVPDIPAGPSLSMEWEDDEMETHIYDKLPEDKEKPAVMAPAEAAARLVFEDPAALPAVAAPPKSKGVSLGVVLSIMAVGVVIAAIILVVLLIGVDKEESMLVIVPEPRDALVKIDGNTVETEFPPTVEGLEPGKHTLIVSSKNYETKVIDINLSEGQNTQVVTLIRMKAISTGFSLETEPPGAAIVINGKPYPHKTPVRIIDLEDGTHAIRVEKDNYLPYTTEVDLKAGQIIAIPKVVLSAKSITASITSVPDDAKVYLIRDGQKKYVGKTPYNGELDPSGTYSVTIQKSGYGDWGGDIQFQPGRDSVSLLAQLVETGSRQGVKDGGEGKKDDRVKTTKIKKIKKTGSGNKGKKKTGSGAVKTGGGTGFMSVSTQPWTIVYIDGKKIRNTPLIKYPLPSGQHKVRLINTQFNINQSYTVIIVAGQVTKIIKNLAQ